MGTDTCKLLDTAAASLKEAASDTVAAPGKTYPGLGSRLARQLQVLCLGLDIATIRDATLDIWSAGARDTLTPVYVLLGL